MNKLACLLVCADGLTQSTDDGGLCSDFAHGGGDRLRLCRMFTFTKLSAEWAFIAATMPASTSAAVSEPAASAKPDRCRDRNCSRRKRRRWRGVMGGWRQGGGGAQTVKAEVEVRRHAASVVHSRSNPGLLGTVFPRIHYRHRIRHDSSTIGRYPRVARVLADLTV